MKLKIDNNKYNFQFSTIRRNFVDNYNEPMNYWLNEITIYIR